MLGVVVMEWFCVGSSYVCLVVEVWFVLDVGYTCFPCSNECVNSNNPGCSWQGNTYR